MIGLFLGDIFSILTTVLVIGLLSFAVVKLSGRFPNLSWGMAILLLIAVGLAVSFLSAMRDG